MDYLPQIGLKNGERINKRLTPSLIWMFEIGVGFNFSKLCSNKYHKNLIDNYEWLEWERERLTEKIFGYSSNLTDL